MSWKKWFVALGVLAVITYWGYRGAKKEMPIIPEPVMSQSAQVLTERTTLVDMEPVVSNPNLMPTESWTAVVHSRIGADPKKGLILLDNRLIDCESSVPERQRRDNCSSISHRTAVKMIHDPRLKISRIEQKARLKPRGNWVSLLPYDENPEASKPLDTALWGILRLSEYLPFESWTERVQKVLTPEPISPSTRPDGRLETIIPYYTTPRTIGVGDQTARVWEFYLDTTGIPPSQNARVGLEETLRLGDSSAASSGMPQNFTGEARVQGTIILPGGISQREESEQLTRKLQTGTSSKDKPIKKKVAEYLLCMTEPRVLENRGGFWCAEYLAPTDEQERFFLTLSQRNPILSGAATRGDYQRRFNEEMITALSRIISKDPSFRKRLQQDPERVIYFPEETGRHEYIQIQDALQQYKIALISYEDRFIWLPSTERGPIPLLDD